MPTHNENNSGTPNKLPAETISEFEEQALLDSFGFDESDSETKGATPKTILPPVKRSKMSNRAPLEKIEKQTKISAREEMIATAKTLLARAGTSVEELANNNIKVKGAFAPTKKANLKSKSKDTGSDTIDTTQSKDEDKEISKPKDLDPFTDLEAVSEESSSTSESTDLDERFRKKTVIAYKKGFFHYLGVLSCLLVFIAISLIIYKFINSLISEPIPTVDEVAIVSREAAEAAKSAEAQLTLIPIEEDNQVVIDAKKVILDYFAAGSKRFAYSFVNSGPDLHSAFNKYWENEEDFNPDELSYNEGFTLPNDSQWLSFYYGKRTKRRHIVLTKKNEESFKIDWQTLSEIETISLGDLAQQAKTEPFLIRAWISTGDQYPDELTSIHWQSYVAHDIRGEKIACYVPKKTLLFNSIDRPPYRDYKSHPVGGDKGLYVKMLVHKPQIGADYVKVLDVISTSWHKEVDSLRVE